MNKTSPDLKENLLSIFREWIAPRLASYEEPARLGTPKGNPIGFPKKKFYAANLMLLYGAFTLKELAKEAGISHDQMRRWRTESQFMDISKYSLVDFAIFIMNKLDDCDDPVEYKRLLNSLLFREDIYSFYNKELLKYAMRSESIMSGLNNLVKLLHLHGFRTYRLSQKNTDRLDAELARVALDWCYQNLIKYLPVNEDSSLIVTLLDEIFKPPS